MKKLNIGSGANYREDWVNMDKWEDSSHHQGKTIKPDVIADAHHLPFKDNSFEEIAMRHVLEHLEFPLLALREAYRVLKPNGVINIEVPDPKRIRGERSDHLYSWTKWTLKQIVMKSGFKIDKYEERGKINQVVRAIKE